MAAKKKTKRVTLKKRHSMEMQHKQRCPITPERHRRLLEDLETGDWPAMVAIRNGISPGTLRQWVLKGLDPESDERYRRFADEFVGVEARMCGQLVKVIMDSALGRGSSKPYIDADTGEEVSPPNVGDAKWLLCTRFQFLWRQRKDGTLGGESIAEVVSHRIEQIEQQNRDAVRRILAQLPDDAKRAARKEGFLVP